MVDIVNESPAVTKADQVSDDGGKILYIQDGFFQRNIEPEALINHIPADFTEVIPFGIKEQFVKK